MYIVFLGAPGVGKGTQCRRTSEKYDLPHVSTGDIIRAAISAKTPLGQEFTRYVDSGELVPDQMVVEMVAERLREDDCGGGCLLDGFPRTVAQAEALEQSFAAQGRRLAGVIEIAASEDELRRRLTERGEKEGRSDDTPETIAARLHVYQSETAPLIEFYRQRKLLHQVDGIGTPDEVFARISATIDGFAADAPVSD
jgi:adenylate kinase